MATRLEVVNMALAEVAEVQPLTSLSEDTTPARLASLQYAQAVREVLREGQWKCARVMEELTEASPAPDFGWLKAYTLPTDLIRLVSFNDVDPDDVREELFEIHGSLLLTDEATASIVYVKDLSADDDVSAMDPLLTKVLILNLASKLAWPLQQSRTLQENLVLRFQEAMRKAKAADARDEFRPLVNRYASSAWLAARSNSTN